MKRRDINLFILNLYSSPQDKGPAVPNVLRKTLQLSKGTQLLVAGDLNAPHAEWGYVKSSKKGMKL